MLPHDPVVSVAALTRRFDDIVALNEIAFDVRPGELFGIVGPDGAGKTTLLRILAGVLPPTSGDATVLGFSVAREPERVKPHLAYMAQRFGVYADLTVRENILFYADLYRVPKRARAKRLERLYAFSRLGEFQHRLAGQLSGGMKQKLSLSCALIHQPALLLLDEPTFGVDPISRRDLWLIVHEMVAAGMTAIVTTSYMDEAERCDRVALLNGGRVLALDAPARIQQRLDGRLFVIHSASPRALRAAIAALPAVQTATLFGDAVHAVVTRGTAAAVLAAELAAAGAEFDAVEPAAPSLEDAFMELVTADVTVSAGGAQ
jgi:ABC-2 type transport system ATP-binding protein